MSGAFLKESVDGGSRAMNKLGKIAPIIAILACLGSLFFAYELQVMKKTHLTKIGELTDSYNTTSADLAKTKSTLKTAQSDLTKSKSDLAQADTDLQATKVALDQKTQEADALKTQVADKDKELEQAKTDFAASQLMVKKITDGLSKAGITDIDNIDKLSDKIVSLGDENKILGQQLTTMHAENQQLKDKLEYLTTTPIGLRGHVTVVQEKWGFLVLDIGQAQRVQPNAEFLVYRDTKLVGKVQVVSVAANNCIAQILPEYQRSTPVVGDLIIH
jgi:septal ring factor EnvC (AmiA/AmiB activator)